LASHAARSYDRAEIPSRHVPKEPSDNAPFDKTRGGVRYNCRTILPIPCGHSQIGGTPNETRFQPSLNRSYSRGGGGSDPNLPPSPQYVLILDIVGGCGNVRVQYGTQPPVDYTVDYGEVKKHITFSSTTAVTLTANGIGNYTFLKWAETESTNSTDQVTVSASQTWYRTAIFAPKSQDTDTDGWHTLHASVTPADAATAGCAVYPSPTSAVLLRGFVILGILCLLSRLFSGRRVGAWQDSD
jgi:hypothetical protein